MAALCWVSFSFVLICCITNVCSQECRYKWQCEAGKLCCKGPQSYEGVCIESTDSTNCRCEADSDCPFGKACLDHLGDDDSICGETTDAYEPEPFTSPEVDFPTISNVEPVTGYEWDDPYDDTDKQSSGSGTLYLIIFVAIFVKGFLWCACFRIRYRSYFQLQRTATLPVVQTKLNYGRQNTALPRASCDVDMQPGNAYSNAVVDVDEGTPPLLSDAPPPYNPPIFEQSKNVNEEPAHVVEMETGSSASNPRRAVVFKEEEISLLPVTAGAQSKGSEEFKQH